MTVRRPYLSNSAEWQCVVRSAFYSVSQNPRQLHQKYTVFSELVLRARLWCRVVWSQTFKVWIQHQSIIVTVGNTQSNEVVVVFWVRSWVISLINSPFRRILENSSNLGCSRSFPKQKVYGYVLCSVASEIYLHDDRRLQVQRYV